MAGMAKYNAFNPISEGAFATVAPGGDGDRDDLDQRGSVQQ